MTTESENMRAKQNFSNEPIAYTNKNLGTNGEIKLPFDVSTDLNQFSKIFVDVNFDNFRIIHCCERCIPSFDFIVYGELPDGDKKIIFTCSKHNQCCKCCDNCIISTCLCDYICCNSIVFQMDYKRNNKPFYTQGINIQRGCYCCKCNICFSCCSCFCTPSTLYLRQNTDPDSPDFDVGIKKGRTVKSGCFCLCNKVVSYFTQDGAKGSSVRLPCCKDCCVCCCNLDCYDYEIAIEDEIGNKVGNIIVPNGMCSEKVKDKCCYMPRNYFEINYPPNFTSEQKFQIIADLIHLIVG